MKSTSHTPIKVMLDTGIIIHSEFAEHSVKEEKVTWGNITISAPIIGYKRKAESHDKEYQKQLNALFTIGRLIRNGLIIPYTYNELSYENKHCREQVFNALNNCHHLIENCPPALERSKFRQTLNYPNFMSKGGKKDKKKGLTEDFSQICFLNWLNELDDANIDCLLKYSDQINLTKFETENLQKLSQFKFLCKHVRSSENYPDAFHLWTAECNKLDVFLTLEKNFLGGMEGYRHPLKVLRPLGLLEIINITEIDPVPIEHDHFYPFVEIH